MRYMAAGLRAWMASNCASVRLDRAAGSRASPPHRPRASRRSRATAPAGASASPAGDRRSDDRRVRCSRMYCCQAGSFLARRGKETTASTYSSAADRRTRSNPCVERDQVGEWRRDHGEGAVQRPGPGQEAARADAGARSRPSGNGRPSASETGAIRTSSTRGMRRHQASRASPATAAAGPPAPGRTSRARPAPRSRARAAGRRRNGRSIMLPMPEKISIAVSTRAKAITRSLR